MTQSIKDKEEDINLIHQKLNENKKSTEEKSVVVEQLNCIIHNLNANLEKNIASIMELKEENKNLNEDKL